jgi:hypothetical protein
MQTSAKVAQRHNFKFHELCRKKIVKYLFSGCLRPQQSLSHVGFYCQRLESWDLEPTPTKSISQVAISRRFQ